MKKKVETIILLLTLLIITIATFQFITLAVANPSPKPILPTTPDKNEPTITINEPFNKTYNVGTIHYSLIVRKPSSWFDYDPVHGQIILIWYTIDNNKEIEIADEPDYTSQQPFNYEGDITNLSDGNHSFQIHIHSCSYYNSLYDKNNSQTWNAEEYYYIDTYSNKINFTIDTSSPIINLLSIENRTYYTTNIPLEFTLNEPSTKIAVSLDNSEIIVYGNTSLTDVPIGSHNITLYATDTAGNIGKSETINFTVSQQETENHQSEPFPIIPITASIGVIVIIIASLLVYSKKYGRGVESA
ncbi:MAG TPA: hypothetical protein VK209_03935 [Candidatus Sulfotelmatobacter sp.]|nr:hypothetical protein [Candidatus Sulfotelmatobacter sp.]